MKGSRAHSGVTANENTTARSCGERTFVRSIVAVMHAARSLWGRHGVDPDRKPDIELASRLKCGLRSAQYVLAGEKGLTADGFARLLVSDAGPRVFRELADHIDDATLAAFGREIEAAQLRAQRAAIERRMESLQRGGVK